MKGVKATRHRLAAIIFTDISGYTSLMGADESAAMKTLQINRKIHHHYFKKFNSTYFKQMGDGFMAVFDSISEAFYAASNIIVETKNENIQVRIGIHEGDIIFKDNDVYGDGVNVAARLEQFAKPGNIYISDSVKRALANKPGIECSFIEQAKLKNVDEPVKIYTATIDPQKLPSESSENNNPATIRKKLKNIVLAGSMLMLFALILMYVNGLIFHSPNKPAALLPGNSIAVLPFENIGQSEQYNHLGVCFADGILTKLSMLDNFVIINSASSFKYENSKTSLSEIAADLGVTMILQGSYQVFEDKIRINAKLVDVNKSKNLLAESYSGNLDRIFKLQDQASEGLFRLLGKSEVNFTPTPATSMDALKFYHQGNSILNRSYLPKSDLEESRSYLRKALSSDPDYFEAVLGLSKSFLLEVYYGYNSVFYVKDSIQKYLEKAASISPKDGRILSIRGSVHLYEKDIELARKELLMSQRLNPNYGHTYYSLSLLSLYDADREKSLDYINKAIELDPLNEFYVIPKTAHSILSFDLDLAEKLVGDILKKEPGSNTGLFLKGTLLCQQKQYQDALHAMLMRSIGENTNWLVAYLQGKVGNAEKCKEIIDVLLKRRESQYVSSVIIAIAYLGLSDYEQVFKWLEIAKKENDDWSLWIVFSAFEPLHENPEFIEYLKEFKVNNLFQKLYPNTG